MEDNKKKLWDNYKIVGEVQKGVKFKFVVAAATVNGFRFVTIREFYYRKRDNAWLPGRDGITIPLINPIDRKNPVDGKVKVITPMKDMMELLNTAFEEASTMELADPENELWFTPKSAKEKQ